MLSSKLQTILASATLHEGIKQLAFIALKNPVYVGLASEKTNKIKAEPGTQEGPGKETLACPL